MNIFLLLLLITSVLSLNVIVDNEEVDDPHRFLSDRLSRSSLKSKFKEFIPPKKNSITVPVIPGKTVGESFVPKSRHESKGYPFLSTFRTNWFSNQIQQEDENEKTPYRKTDSPIEDPFQDVTIASASTKVTDSKSVESSISPSLVVNSKKSWIHDFLNFKRHEDVGKATPSPTAKEFSLLSTHIQNYQDTASDERDLKRWTKLIVEQDRAERQGKLPHKFKDYNYKQYGLNHKDLKSATVKNEIELDIEEFISYLVNHQGFKESDLQFLRQQSLDYGLRPRT
ncbi:uncharacterized protein RJT20DRAFT_134636 [Scheffersomyces xylosifermentans]|uniref:uncharacterized protein n=1 Tax=Scheffersomyces xylosifermentans TaxID=1304137 RepID=UPI00315DE029